MATDDRTVSRETPTSAFDEQFADTPIAAAAARASEVLTPGASGRLPRPPRPRIMTIAKGPDAPTRVDYTFPGSVLTAQDDGTVLVEVDGVPASTVLPAWSIDADGNEVPTWYEISGDTLTQVVEHHGAAYPVVSDPASVGFCWLNWLPAICIKYTRAETVTAYNQMALGAAATVVGAALCGKIPFPGAPTACRALLAARAYDLQSSLRSAYSSGKCLDARMTWPIVPGAFIDYRAVNC